MCFTSNEYVKQVETLLRQGKEYGLGGCIATQRITYLNTNALKQLHTCFVGTLPRPYDGSVVSNTFMIDSGFWRRLRSLRRGNGFVQLHSHGTENVPIFI